MDPLSMTAGIIAVLELTATVINYLNSVKDAPKDRATCATEASNVYNLLINLRYRLDGATTHDPWFTAVRGLAIENGPLDQFKTALEQLMSRLAPADGLKGFGQALTWKFHKTEVENILSRIERLKVLTQIALEMDHFKLSQAIKRDTTNIKEGIAELGEGVNTLQRNHDDQEYQTIIDWLSPLNFRLKQLDVLSQRREGTGEWYLESKGFTGWVEGPPSTLWGPGIPGAGKTVLASIVVNYLQRSRPDNNVAVLCIYCSYKERIEQTTENLVASLLKQLAQEKPVISDNIRSLYRAHITKGTRPTLTELTHALRSEIYSYRKEYIIVDALDECSEDQGLRRDFLGALQSLSDSVNLMVTSRPHITLEGCLNGIVQLPICANDKDIEGYIRGRIPQEDRLARHVKADSTLEEDIVDTMIASSKGMFLLARLHMDSLVSKHKRRDIRRALENLPEELNSTYEEAMERVRRQTREDRKLAERVLSWITYAKGPLTAVELQHALAIEPEMPALGDEDLDDIEILVSVCAGLVVIDDESGIIRLVHYTTQEYFESAGESLFPEAQEDIAKACISYLSLDAFEDGYCRDDVEFECRLENFAFIDYASHYLGAHALGREETVKSMAIELLLDVSKVSSIRQVTRVLGYQYKYNGISQFFEKDISGLHLAAGWGLKVIVKELLEKGLEVNVKDGYGLTPLCWAAKSGHEPVVKLLLDRDDVEADSKDKEGRTPLSGAAGGGHEAVVKLLLDRDDVEANSKDEDGLTPLFYAAGAGHEAVVKLLLDRDDVKSDSKERGSQTPLSFAAQGGHEAVAKLLLDRDDVEADSKDKRHRTPLSYTAQEGYEVVVKLLLDRDDVEANSKDVFGRTPLSYTAQEGYEAVVKLLLDQDDVEANSKDVFGRTPLSYAAGGGREAVVKLLLNIDDVDAYSEDKDGCTPLWWAIKERNEEAKMAWHYRDNWSKEYEVVIKMLENRLRRGQEDVL